MHKICKAKVPFLSLLISYYIFIKFSVKINLRILLIRRLTYHVYDEGEVDAAGRVFHHTLIVPFVSLLDIIKNQGTVAHFSLNQRKFSVLHSVQILPGLQNRLKLSVIHLITIIHHFGKIS